MAGMFRLPDVFIMQTNPLTSRYATLIDAECNTLVMTAEATARVPKENPGKKTVRQAVGEKGKTGDAVRGG